ncbi:MAG: DUF4982 domain-containing protein [Clostridia bacterium]|nr:DUF4982 domain-containing protein [Clostridia bacterium]
MLRTRIKLNENWHFHEGDIETVPLTDKNSAYQHAKTRRALWGPASMHYNSNPDNWDTSRPLPTEPWTAVTLPHDYIITQTPDPKNNNTLGYFTYPNAWYRKRFRLEKEDADKHITLTFEAVSTEATVWVNGCKMAHHHTGYTPFTVDITDIANFDGDNVIAVYVQSGDHESWWYEGAGIVRHVWLEKTADVSVDQYGVFVHPEKQTDTLWRCPVDVTVRNDRFSDVTVCVKTTVLDESGQALAAAEGTLAVPCKDKRDISLSMDADSPALWDTDEVHMHTLRTEIFALDGTPIDCTDTRFGFREIRFDPNEGFFLNGRSVKINGVCCHQDYGLTGRAMPDNIHVYRTRLLREMGANGYRCAHYPTSEYAMDVFDEMGMLVMDEVRWFSTAKEHIEELETLIRRDRNHPSVIFWSMGNEEPFFADDHGRRILQTMVALTHKLDPTRPTTAAVNMTSAREKIQDLVDVMGINYYIEDLDNLHAKYPDKPIVSAECCAMGTTRGWYYPDDPARGYIYAFNRVGNDWVHARDITWKHFVERPYVSGGYQWAGIEHRGETVWPRLCSQSGALDLFLVKKDAFYQNLSMWSEKPMVHILPHWNLPAMVGQTIPVIVCTNCDTLELFVNGVSQGIQSIEVCGFGQWDVVYQPGTVSVKGWRNGVLCAEETISTTGAPHRLHMEVQNDGEFSANGEDLIVIHCTVLDADGNPVPDASPFVSFTASGAASVIGTGSDIADHIPPQNPSRRMRAGVIVLALRTRKTAGDVTVIAECEHLLPTALHISVPQTK